MLFHTVVFLHAFILVAASIVGPAHAVDAEAPPQHPALLDRYALRPPWKVAGVDYGVGYPTSTKLTDPSSISARNVSVDATAHVVAVTGSNVTLNGFDFSLAGGWRVEIKSGTNILITNSNFRVGSNALAPIQVTDTTENVIISNSVLDGGATPNLDRLIVYNASNGGTLVFENNWVKNTGADGIWFLNGAKLIVRGNLFESIGLSPGAHADAIQFTQSDNTGSQIVFNTFLFGQDLAFAGHLPGEGIQIESQVNSVGIFSPEVGNNTIVSTRPTRVNSYLIALRGYPIGSTANVLNAVNCHDNYMDRGSGYGFFYPGGGGSNYTHTNNIDMVTGRVVGR